MKHLGKQNVRVRKKSMSQHSQAEGSLGQGKGRRKRRLVGMR